MRNASNGEIFGQQLDTLGLSAVRELRCGAFPINLPRNDDVREIAIQEWLPPSATIVRASRAELRLEWDTSRPVVNLFS